MVALPNYDTGGKQYLSYKANSEGWYLAGEEIEGAATKKLYADPESLQTGFGRWPQGGEAPEFKWSEVPGSREEKPEADDSGKWLPAFGVDIYVNKKDGWNMTGWVRWETHTAGAWASFSKVWGNVSKQEGKNAGKVAEIKIGKWSKIKYKNGNTSKLLDLQLVGWTDKPDSEDDVTDF
jgi:hypothetical protein